jgi:hypothetical protein
MSAQEEKITRDRPASAPMVMPSAALAELRGHWESSNLGTFPEEFHNSLATIATSKHSGIRHVQCMAEAYFDVWAHGRLAQHGSLLRGRGEPAPSEI